MFYLEINKKNLNAYGAIGQATNNEVKKKTQLDTMLNHRHLHPHNKNQKLPLTL